jgi:hypothetical protein
MSCLIWREHCAGTEAGNMPVALQVMQGMSLTITTPSRPSSARLPRSASTGIAASGFVLVWLLASVFVHPLPRRVSDRAGAPLLLGADITPSVADVLAHACSNCHSENTSWPWYSHVAPVSWLVENDVKHAREHLNFSRWDNLEAADRRVLLTAIATVIENREMPPHKYVALHPEAKLSADDSTRVIEWTRTERRRLRASTDNLMAK